MNPAALKAGLKSRFPLYFSLLFTVLFFLLYWPGMLGLPYPGAFRRLEDLWQDRLFKMRRSELRGGDPRLLIAALDAETGKKYGFPLPRRIHARLLDRLKSYGARTVVFDVMFLEPREDDSELIAATKRFGRVIHLYHTETEETTAGEVVKLNLPIRGLAQASQYLAYPDVNEVLDEDGHLRRAKLFDRRYFNPQFPGRSAASLDAAGLASFLDKPLEKLEGEFASPWPRLLLLNFRAPRQWLAHPLRDGKLAGEVANLPEISSPYARISAMDILSGELSSEQKAGLKGALVIVGSTSIGYFDHYPTPFLPQAPGAEYHANVIDNILNGDFLRPVPRAYTLLILLVMIWAPYFLLRTPPPASAAAAAALASAWFALAYWGFGRGLRVDFVAPLTALVSCFLAQTVHRVRREGQEKKFIKNLFGQFVAPQVVDDLARNPRKVRLGGEKRDMSIFFLDIAHFTDLSEKMPPEDLILFLNRYLSALSQVVHDHQGVVDKYIGDCIMAFWNAPLSLEDHRAKACLAAVECQEVLQKLNQGLDSSFPLTPAIRIGLNSGMVTVGLTGSQKKLQYTVIGDEVNLASRLEGANKFFGSRIMASQNMYEGARQAVEARPLGRIQVVGKESAVQVYELLARKGSLSAEWEKALPAYEEGMSRFQARDYVQAEAAFARALEVFPDDGPSLFYLEKSRQFRQEPPPAGWNGVFQLTGK
ncbi:MAG: adenylate/guanylate cyclase domain-containing protein [Elusimicrobia bacterium]|nr:adenylate/guanylate cyclase domain-containing protein [Elusimicrobiota bacterium]